MHAGFPPGVINVLPGDGRVCGQAIVDVSFRHFALGFTMYRGMLLKNGEMWRNFVEFSLEWAQRLGWSAFPLCFRFSSFSLSSFSLQHPDVRKIGFTGSTEVGQGIMQSCATNSLKRVSLELGGKSPLIIFGDCDLDKAVRIVRNIFSPCQFPFVVLAYIKCSTRRQVIYSVFGGLFFLLSIGSSKCLL